MSLAKLARRKVKVSPPRAPLVSVLPSQVTSGVEWRLRDCTTAVEVANRFLADNYYNVGWYKRYPPNLKAMRPPRCMTVGRALWVAAEHIILQRIVDYVPSTDHVGSLELKEPS